MSDVFISHATEDKDAIARPLAEALRAKGFEVWYDEYSLRLGDGLREAIDRGLAQSRYGVVILSQSFFKKPWARRELDGLVARETGEGGKRILPIWHGVDATQVREFSPTLADRLAIRTDQGLDVVVASIVRELNEGVEGSPATRPHVTPRKSINVPPGYERRLNAIRFDVASGRDPKTGRPIPPERPLTEAENAELVKGRAVLVPEFVPARPFTIGFIPPRLRVWNFGGGTAHTLKVLINGTPLPNQLTQSQHAKVTGGLPPNDCVEFALNLPLPQLATVDVHVRWTNRDSSSGDVTETFRVES